MISRVCISACAPRGDGRARLRGGGALDRVTARPRHCRGFVFPTSFRRCPVYPSRRAVPKDYKAELQRLKAVDRPTIIQAIKDAREKGDLSENAEYDAARERQGFIEGRIQELEGKISSLQIIDPATVDAAGRIVFGAKVELEDQLSGEVVKYQIVGDDEADIKSGLVSVSSPIARALIGKSEGDMAQVLAPAGKREYAIVSIAYE